MRLALLATSLLGVGLFLAGTAHSADQPRKGGELVFAVSSEPNTYDCQALGSSVAMQALAPHYSTLLKFDAASYPAIAGELADSWTVSADQKTYRFKIRNGVKFHDGSILTAEDIKATFERLRNPPAGVSSLRKASFSDIESIDTVGDSEVIFKLSQPNGAMLSVFASPWNCVYSKKLLEADKDYPSKKVMGTGAFTFVRHENGTQWIGRRFDGYFRGDRPYLDGFKAILFPASATMANAMQGGQIMTDFRGLTPADKTRLTSALGDKVVVDEMPEITHVMFTFNSTVAPFNDPRVRRALSLAVDRWGAEASFRRGTRLGFVGGLMRPGGEYAAPPEELTKSPGFGRDIEASRAEARRLLREAGVPDLKFALKNRSFSPFTESAIYLIDQWRRIGVTVEHQALDNSTWANALGSGNFEAILDFSAEFVDEPAFGFLKYLSYDVSPSSAARFEDRTLDTLYQKAIRSTEKADRVQAVREFERRLLEQSYSVPFLWAQRIIVRFAYMRGWHITPNGPLGQDLVDVWLDR